MTVASYDSRETRSQPAPELRLAELARAGGPLRRVVAAVAGRLVARRGWERLGFARCGDYARERLGLSARSIQEWARVDGQLAQLPGLEAALVSGTLPWSKVRLLARFVCPADEARWIAYAAERSVRALEREVRAVDRGALETGGLTLDAAAGESMEHVRIPATQALCFHWQRVRRYAERVAGENVDAGAALEMVTAEALSALPLDGMAQAQLEVDAAEAALSPGVAARGDADQRDSDPASDGASSAAQPCDAEPPVPHREMPLFLRSLLEGLADADAFELDARLRRAVRLEQRLDAAIGPLLRQVSSAEYAWQQRPRTLAAFARDQLGMSPRKARALLRLERAGDLCSALRRAYRDGALSWVQAQALVPLLSRDDSGRGPWREAWVAFAPRVSVRLLAELVAHALVLREADPEAWARAQAEPETLAQMLRRVADGDATPMRQVCARPTVFEDGLTLRITAPAEVARLFRAVLCTVRRAGERETGRLPSAGQAFEALLAHALHAWGVDEPRLAHWAKRVSPAFARDGWRCTVPGCSSRRNLHAHHIVFRSAGGGDEPENLTTLCAFHHQRGVHGGLIAVRGSAPDQLAFEIGLRPGLPPLARYRAMDCVA